MADERYLYPMEQGDQINNAPPMYPTIPMPNSLDRGDFLETIDPKHYINDLYHKLKGEEQNAKGEWIIKPELKKRAISEAGAWEISNMMSAVSSFNMSFSRITKDEVRARLRNLMKEVMIKCMVNYKEYNITDRGQIWYIKSLVMSNSLGTLNQAGDGSIQEVVKGNVIEHRQVTQEQKRKGLMSGIFGRKGD